MYRSDGSVVSDCSPFVDVDARIRELTQDLCTAFNTANYDHVAALFASHGLFMPPGHEPIQGPPAIERKFREYGENGCQDLRLETTRVESSGDMAVEIGSYTLTIRPERGTPTKDSGKYLKVWRRLGSWLIVGDCWSSNISNGQDQTLQAIHFSGTGNNEVNSQDVQKSA